MSVVYFRAQSDDLSSSIDSLEGFMIGLYTELVNLVLSLINRYTTDYTLYGMVRCLHRPILIS